MILFICINKQLIMLGLALFVGAGCGDTGADENAAQQPEEVAQSKVAEVIAENEEKGLYSIIILHKGESTDELNDAIEPLVKDSDKTRSVIADARDIALLPLFKALRLNPETAPTPLALVLAPGELVTCVFVKPPSASDFDAAILPDQPLSIRKALKAGKRVIVKIQSEKTSGNEETDKAINEFLSDKKNRHKYISLSLALDKKENARFLNQLGIDPAKESQSVILGLKPPLKMISKPFRGVATKAIVDKMLNHSCATGCACGS